MVPLFAADWKFKFEAVLPIMTPVLLIGGMTTGIFTPTEGAVAASIWALFLGLVWYRTLTFKMLVKVSMETIETTATVLFIVAAASIFGWLLDRDARHRHGDARGCSASRISPWVFLLLVNLLLLFVGCFLEPTAAILIAIPVLMPAVTQLGIDPVHFGLIVVLNLMIGLLHPPMGMVLYVLARVARMSLERTTMAILPWLVPLLGSLILITYVPIISLWLPAVVLSMSSASAACADRSELRRNPAGRPCAEGRAHRRHPVVRHAGNADRAHPLRRRRAGRRLHVHDRHRRLVGGRAAARSSRAAPDRPRCRLRSRRSGRISSSPRTPPPSARSRASRWPRSTPRCGTCAAGAREQPLWKVAGGAQRRVPVYTTEGGWLHHPAQQLVDEALAAKAQGFRGAKMKVGKPSIAEDVARLSAVREAVGDAFEIMVDANQAFTVAEACRRAHAYEPLGARAGSRSRCRPRTSPGTSSSPPRRRCRSRSANRSITRRISANTSQRGACSVVQVDCARIGGITPWLKVAHLAETFNVAGLSAFPDGAARLADRRRCPTARGSSTSPSSTTITTSRMAMRRRLCACRRTRPASGSTGTSPPSTRRAVARAAR